MDFDVSPQARLASDVLQGREPPRAPAQELELGELVGYLETFSKSAANILGIPNAESSSPNSREAVSTRAWNLARAIKEKSSLVRVLRAKDGTEFPLGEALRDLLSGSELLSELALGPPSQPALKGQDMPPAEALLPHDFRYQMLRRAVQSLASGCQEHAARTKEPILWERAELRRMAAQNLLNLRAERKEERASQTPEPLTAGPRKSEASVVREALSRAAVAASAQAQDAERLVDSSQRWISVARKSLSPSFLRTHGTLVLSTVLALTGPTIALIEKLAGSSSKGWVFPAVLVAETALAIFLISQPWKKWTRQRGKSQGGMSAPQVRALREKPSFGSYVTKDKNFERAMGVTEVSVFIPAAARLMPLSGWLTELPKLYPEAQDLPSRADFFQEKIVPRFRKGEELSDGETEITLPQRQVKHSLPLSPHYEVRALTFLDKSGSELGSAETRIEQGILGSFILCENAPRGTHSIAFRVGPRTAAPPKPESVERIKKYLPIQPHSGPIELTQMRRALILLHPNDAERAERWFSQVKALGYGTTEDPLLSNCTRNFGLFWNTTFHAHRLGNCDTLSTHGVAELLTIGTAAFQIGGMTPDSVAKSFLGYGNHAQSAALTSDGVRIYDLTIGAKRYGGFDLSQLSKTERAELLSERFPETLEEAEARGLLLRRIIKPFDPQSSRANVGHSFRDDARITANPAESAALLRVQRLLQFKAKIEEFRRNRFREFAEYLEHPEVFELLYSSAADEPRSGEKPHPLPPELHPRLWPTSPGILKDAIADALREKELPPEQREHILFFAARRALSEARLVPRFMAEQNPNKYISQLEQTLQDMPVEQRQRMLTESELSPLAPVQKTYPPIFREADLLEIVPTELFDRPKDFSANTRGVFSSALLWNTLTSMLGSLEFQPGSGTLSTSQFKENLSLQGILDLLELARRASAELHIKDLHEESFAPTLIRSAAAVMAINTAAHERYKGSAAPSGADDTLNRIDQASFEILSNLLGPKGLRAGPFAALPTLFEPSPLNERLLALLSNYAARESGRFPADNEGHADRIAELNFSILANTMIAADTRQRATFGRYLDTWLSLPSGPSRRNSGRAFSDSDQSQAGAWIREALKPLEDGSKRAPRLGGIAGKILDRYRLSEESVIAATLRELCTRGIISPSVILKIHFEDEGTSAELLASRAELSEAYGRPYFALAGEKSRAPALDASRVPWLMDAMITQESSIGKAARLGFALGGINQEAQGSFKEFAEKHPEAAARLSENLRRRYATADRLLERNSILIFDLEDGDMEEGTESSADKERSASSTIRAVIKAAIVANAFDGLPRIEVYAAMQWTAGVLATFGEGGLRRLAETGSVITEAALAEALSRFRTAPTDEQKLTDAELQAALTRHGLSPHPADRAVTVSLEAPLSARAKVAALLLVSQFESEIAGANPREFEYLARALGMAPVVFRQLTKTPKPSGAPLQTRLRLEALSPEDFESPFTRHELFDAAIGEVPPTSATKHSSGLRYRFPEFSDLVLRGLKTPPGETGIYDTTRAYAPGMPARLLDQRASERSGKLLVRDRVEEIDRPTILCLELDDLSESTSELGISSESPTESFTRKLGIRRLARELLVLDASKQRSAVVLTSSGVPVSVLLSPRSRLKQFFVSNPETSAICEFVPSFSSTQTVQSIGKLLLSSARLRIFEAHLSSSGETPPAPHLLAWFARHPKGARLKVFDSLEALSKGVRVLSSHHQSLKLAGGELEIIPFDQHRQLRVRSH